MPLAIFSLFFEEVALFSYPVYIMAFSIVIMVYNYIRFGLDKGKEQARPQPWPARMKGWKPSSPTALKRRPKTLPSI